MFCFQMAQLCMSQKTEPSSARSAATETASGMPHLQYCSYPYVVHYEICHSLLSTCFIIIHRTADLNIDVIHA